MYTIVAPVPDKVARVITPLRQKYDPLAKIIPPNITVIEPFKYAGSPEELHTHLKEIGETHSPIKASLVGWDVYEQACQLRLPLVAGRNEFVTLRRNLLTGPLTPPAGVDEDYWPHIVFGRFSTRAELEQARQALKTFKPQFVFRVTALVLLHRTQTGQPWHIQYRFGLKATLSSEVRKRRKTGEIGIYKED